MVIVPTRPRGSNTTSRANRGSPVTSPGRADSLKLGTRERNGDESVRQCNQHLISLRAGLLQHGVLGADGDCSAGNENLTVTHPNNLFAHGRNFIPLPGGVVADRPSFFTV